MRHFVYFYDKSYVRSALRLNKQIKKSKLNHSIFEWQPEDIIGRKDSPINVSDLETRGIGFWSWKPYIILKTLENLKNDEILFYLDSGCHFNKFGIKKLKYYEKFIKKESILCFESGKKSTGIKAYGKIDIWLEVNWIKKKLLDFFNMNDISFRPMRVATAIGFKNDEKSRMFLSNWLELCKNRNLINDEISHNENSEFIENRHDQSIFSLLTYKYNLIPLSNREIELPGQSPLSWKLKLINQPIIAYRDKSEKIIFKIKRKLKFK